MQSVNELFKTRDVYWVAVKDKVRVVARYMHERRTGAVAVKDGDEVVGVFSERDLMRLVANGDDPAKVTVGDVMSTDLKCICYTDGVKNAKAQMRKLGVRHLLVFSDDGAYHGLVSIRDIMQADAQETEGMLQEMNDAYYEEAYKSKWWIAANRVVREPYVPQ